MLGVIVGIILLIFVVLILISCVKVVPQSKALVVERLGAYQATWGVGLHFNSKEGSANHSLYNDNTFRDNGTAVVLEQVPTDLALNFIGSVFEGNGTDIDNRCGQPLDLSRAEFR